MGLNRGASGITENRTRTITNKTKLGARTSQESNARILIPSKTEFLAMFEEFYALGQYQTFFTLKLVHIVTFYINP